jgi:hypothetical protein
MMQERDALSVERVCVGEGRVEALVRVDAGTPLRTSAIPDLMQEVLRLLPGIARHRCECGSAHGIVAELGDTELAHLLEHVALELMALSGSPRSLRGETVWDFAEDGHGVFRVVLEYDDDLVALGALSEAATIVNRLVDDPTVSLDVASSAARLVAARS